MLTCLDEIRKNQLIDEITQSVSSDKQEKRIAYVKSMHNEPMDEDSEDESNGGLDEEQLRMYFLNISL
ncbi:hypothetical protein RvY_02670 [Ramazzottius varieornatus]|uniref:Uncharacterized protein n=1 Tax=Ramazzottius varieornatus TaxID=947166 RepID=A0A1D1UNX9_RAMVA|nr:hypothetical protein RvY_02670 [Ramazzottius varieornatus]